MKAEFQRKGTPIEDLGLLIAATAIATGQTLVTNNERHFRRIPELKISNWTK